MAADSDNKGLRDLPIAQIVRRAYERRVLVPAFNIPYLPQVEPIARTLKELDCFALLEVARPDIQRFEAESYAAVAWEYERHADPSYLRLHQDHVPVIDEEQRRVDWRPLIQEALELGYDSVMLDGSRLPLEDNIAATKSVVAMAHPKTAVEGELGAVLGHEKGPLPPYEELYRSGRGFTDVEEAERFAREAGVDWLSIAVGNVHGAISGAAKDREKVRARLNMAHLRRISERVALPLVLHGGSGIELSCVLEAVENGITKINIATAIRQAYEARLREGGSIASAQQAVADVVAQHIEEYRIAGSATALAAL
jgi:fructose/tagatose bisphosphate aldolase